MGYKVVFEPDAMEHLRAISARDRGVMLDAIDQQLSVGPTEETRNRKRLRPNELARWELRVGAYRVFYDVLESESEVRVLAVGYKDRERLFIGGKEYAL